jgi:glycosyltransferase involved in cell wall biosynthesis
MTQSRVAVIYPFIPHYRQPVFSAMAQHAGDYSYVFFAGSNTIDVSIKSGEDGSDFETRPAPIFHRWGITFQFGLLRAALGREFASMVFLGNPYFASTWLYALLARLRGKNVLFWTHGWLTEESGFKGFIRNTFYRLAHSLLLYGERARDIGLSVGFNQRHLQVVYNSLDYQKQATVRRRLEAAGTTSALPALLREKLPYVACIARLTSKCSFDLAIDAIAQLNEKSDRSLPLVLIGDGPERAKLAAQAQRLRVDVVFLGEIYDEQIIGAVLFHARMVVSPGKVGLTAMHSLAYGTPVITHGEFSEQMPEFEAVTPSVTGDFFRQGDVADLAETISKWIRRPRDAEERRQCIAVIESRYTPERQVAFIEAALATVERK